MNIFMHGNIAAGFGVLKAKFDKDMRVLWGNGSPTTA